MSDAELQEKEQAAAEDGQAEQAQDNQEKGQVANATGEQGGGFYKSTAKKGLGGGKGGRNAAIGLGAVGVFLVGAVVLLLILAGSLKAIHFSTILRSTGFAGSQLVMRQAFSQIAYSNWVVNNETAELPRSKLLDRLRGQDMRKVQRQLTDEGKFRYTVDGEGRVNGFDLDGKNVNFDDLAKRMGKESFKDLTFREKMTARQYMNEDIKFKMADTFDMETRGFRNAFWKGFREATGIKMSRFRAVVRDKFGTGQVNADADTDSARMQEELMADDGARGGNDKVNEAADETSKGVRDAAKEGRRVKAKTALDNYLKTKGTDLVKFTEGMSKVSDWIFVSTIYCMGHDLSKTGERISRQMEISMAQFGHQQQTTADQIKAGDVTSGDAAFANKEWGGDEETRDAAASPLYQQAIGNDVGEVDTSSAPRMNVSAPFLDWLKPVDEAIRTGVSGGLNKLPIVGDTVDSVIDKAADEGCEVVMNPYAQGAIFLGELGLTYITGGGSKLLTTSLKAIPLFVGFAGLGQLIEHYVQQLANTGIAGNEVGEDRYTASAVSTDYLNSQTGRGTTYARPLSNDESYETKRVAMEQLRDHYNEGSFSERYFAISNPYSLLGTSVAQIPTSATNASQAVASMGTNLGSTFTRLISVVGSVFGGSKVSAVAKQDLAKANGYFGVNQWGWTTGETEVLKTTDPIQNAAEVEADIERDPDYYNTLEGCYSSGKLFQDLDKDDNCKPEKLSTQRALKWRIYKVNLFAATQISSVGLNEE